VADADQVIAALSDWAAVLITQRPEIERIGIGSYARGDCMTSRDRSRAFETRLSSARRHRCTTLPVPADVWSTAGNSGAWRLAYAVRRRATR
jgi:hypothetical protein